MNNLHPFLIAWYVCMISCSPPSPEEKKTPLSPPITQQQADSIIARTGNFPARTNTRAELDDKIWVSTSFGINVFNRSGKKTYAIFLSDGATKIAINYSGPEEKGIVNTGDVLQASVIDMDKVAYPCDKGFIEFTEFDTVKKRMSGHFKLYCAEAGDKSKTKNISNATFSDLGWK